MTNPNHHDRYTFHTNPHTSQQLATLQTYLDPVTTRILAQIPLPATARCLELGAGAGSIAHWLAGRIEPPGHIVATDLDTRHLTPTDTIEIRRHDLRHGIPHGGPWDLIHARLVLLHLPQRRQLLRQLATTLTPGGWLVIGEFSDQPLTVLAGHPKDADLFTTVTDTLQHILTTNGADLGWARYLHTAMHHTGLTNIHTTEHAESWTGGSPGARLHHINSQQKHQELLDAGLASSDLDRFRALTADPRFAARSWQFICTRGQRPTATSQ